MNIWKQLKDLMVPGSPLLIGTITAHNSDGTSSVTLLDGSSIRVRGQAVAIGSKAFVRDGVVEGAAPNLTEVQIDV